MNTPIMRALRRLFILAIGFAVIYILVRRVYPWLDNYIPGIIALFVVYLVGAYFALPLVFRVALIIWRPTHIPTFSYTVDGQRGDPVNIGIVATESEMKQIMHAAGWHTADPLSFRTSLKTILATIFNRPYNTAPFSNLYLFGRHHDLGFQIPISKSPRKRHHVRFWACVPTEHPTFRDHVEFWLERHDFKKRRKQKEKTYLWVGGATCDVGIGIIRWNGQITHTINEDTNAERDFLIDTINEAGFACKVTTLQAHEPFRFKSHAFGGSVMPDGKIKVCEPTFKKKKT